MMSEYSALHIESFLPFEFQTVYVFGALLMAGILYCCAAKKGHFRWYGFPLVLFFIAVFSLFQVKETGKILPDIVVMVLDESPSQSAGERGARTEMAAKQLLSAFKDLENIKVITKRVGKESPHTRLFDAIEKTLKTMPKERISSVIIITDGQVHDVPEMFVLNDYDVPVHVLLNGKHDEGDRQIVVEKAPDYGFVNSEIEAIIRVDDLKKSPETKARVSVRYSKNKLINVPVTIGNPFKIVLPIERAGENRFVIETEVGSEEISLANNRAEIIINGIRDRLKVLLVSGKPHLSSLFWRNFFKSDASVSLTHYAFFKKNFKQKPSDFDLIVFDRYEKDMLSSKYLEDIADYVQNGGAMMVIDSKLDNTALRSILPASPAGKKVITKFFRPEISSIDSPITSPLVSYEREWGRWFGQTQAVQKTGSLLMTGIDGLPLLITDKVENGRIAMLLSDSIWLWQRDFEKGGPYKKLLDNLFSWLLKDAKMEDVSIAKTKDEKFKASDMMYELNGSKEILNLSTTEKHLKHIVDESKGSFVWLVDIPFERVAPEIKCVGRDKKTHGKSFNGKPWIGLRLKKVHIIRDISQISLTSTWFILVFVLGWLIFLWKKEK